MESKKRILLLYSDAGFGHRSAALAIRSALEEKYSSECVVDFVNPLQDERAPFFLRDSQADYDTIIKSVPELYRIGYEVSDFAVPALFVESALTLMLYDVMEHLVERTKPDVIVSTYPIYQAPCDAVFTMQQINTPMATVVTDLVDVHRVWYNIGIERLLVPTTNVQKHAIKTGIADNKVRVTGIPVSTSIANETRTKAQIRKELGLEINLFTILVTGSKRVEGLPEILEGLNHSGHPIQLVLVAGGDETLYQKMRSVDWHLPVRIYNYVDFIPALLHAADVMVCKAGGLIISESMAAGLPMILIDVIPGQESGNAEYVISCGAGERANNSAQLLNILAHWLQHDRQILNLRKTCSSNNGRPDAAYKIADEVYTLSHTPAKLRTVTHLFKRSYLASLLKKYRQQIQQKFEEFE